MLTPALVKAVLAFLNTLPYILSLTVFVTISAHVTFRWMSVELLWEASEAWDNAVLKNNSQEGRTD